jgi:peptidoglycan/LPS O-acetylase OafA/YrhL
MTMAELGARLQQLPGLTGLRGIGAVWVLLLHMQFGLDIPVLKSGYLGVDLFFILSGFVLSHAHPETVWNMGTYRSFLKARIARIFPMHWTTLALIGMIITFYPSIYNDMQSRFQLRELVLSIFLMQNWGYGRPSPWNLPAWSLSTEWLVSLGFPVFCCLADRSKDAKVSIALSLGLITAFAVFLAATDNPTFSVIGKAGIVRTLCEFAAGCFLYRAYERRIQVTSLMSICGIALVVYGTIDYGQHDVYAVLGFALIVLVAAQPSTGIARLLSTKAMVYLGEISYSVYLLHWILLQVFDRLKVAQGIHGFTLKNAALSCCFVALIFVSATLTYNLIEKPARKALRKLGALPPRSAGVTAR